MMDSNISQPQPTTTPLKTIRSKWFISSMIIMLILGGEAFASEKNMTNSKIPKTKSTASTNTKAVYLKKTDPVYQLIASRVANDLKESARKLSTESPEGKLLSLKVDALPEEKQGQFQALTEKSINDYIDQTHLSDLKTFKLETFFIFFPAFGKMDEKKIAEQYDIRVQSLGDNKYVAEFWEDSKALALSNTSNPGDDADFAIEMMKDLFRLANGRESKDGTTIEINSHRATMVALRYTKMMALIYTQANDGSITFNDPIQPMADFIKNNSK